jgi:hypothetical protein
LKKLSGSDRVICEVFEARFAPVTSRLADAAFVITQDHKPTGGVEVSESPHYLAQDRTTTMGKHDSGTFTPGNRRHQRACERGVTVFESDFFHAEGNARRERSFLATLDIQIDYVNSRYSTRCSLSSGGATAPDSRAAKGNRSPRRRGDKQGWSAGELSRGPWEHRPNLTRFHVGYKQSIRSIGKLIDHYEVAVRESIRAHITRENIGGDFYGAHQMKARFSARHLGLTIDLIAGDRSHHDESDRVQFDPDAITFALDQGQFCFQWLLNLARIFRKAETQELAAGWRLAVAHPLAAQGLSSAQTREAGRDRN